MAVHFTVALIHTVRVNILGDALPSLPLGVLQVIVEPTEQDLLWGQAQELLQSLILLQQTVQLGVELNIDLAQQTTANDLPDQTQNQVLADLNDIPATNVHHRAANTLGRVDHNVVVLGHVESVQLLDLLASLVQDTLINSIRYAVIDQLGQDQTVLALVEHLEGISREGQQVANIGIAGQDSIDVSREFGSLILVDGVGNVRRGALDVDATTTNAALGDMTGSTRARASAGSSSFNHSRGARGARSTRSRSCAESRN